MHDTARAAGIANDATPAEPPSPFPSAATMRRRRVAYATLAGGTVVGLAALMAHVLGAGGLDAVDLAMWAAFCVTLPWTAVGFWNAAIGLALMLSRRDATALAAPVAALGREPAPIEARTAILVCLRNEDPALVERNVGVLLDGLARRPEAAGRLHLFLLSDSDRPGAIAGEDGLVARLERRHGAALPITYRRRESNPGFKAGNLRDFCERWGDAFELALVLDADSVMSAATVLRLVRTMQAEPRLGIVQTLVVGLPSDSPFTRTFQFGMRLGMRSYTLGSAWWQGDCGPYWGHNAILRLAPFVAHCGLPRLSGRGPLSGWVLSHDQLEAVLMRRAGYEVRVLPLEDGSWEQNPPTLLEFARRDLRWCQGNLQYLRLLGMPGLRPLSRCQLALAVLMFVGSPAWLAFVALAAFRDRLVDPAVAGPAFRADAGGLLASIVLAMIFAPKLASVVAALAGAHRPREFGPPGRFLAGVGLEAAFSMMLAPVMAVVHTVFIAGLAFGRTIGWSAQVRDGHRVGAIAAARALWAPTLVGAVLAAQLSGTGVPWLLWLPFCGPLAAAVPFAMATASPAIGRAMARARLAAVPDELAPAPELLALGLPALEGRGAARAAPPGAASGTPATVPGLRVARAARTAARGPTRDGAPSDAPRP